MAATGTSVLANAVVITTTTSFVASPSPFAHKGVKVWVSVSAFTGGTAPTATFIVEENDGLGNWVLVLQSAALNVASGVVALQIFPAGINTANLQVNAAIAQQWRVRVTLQGAPTNATINISEMDTD